MSSQAKTCALSLCAILLLSLFNPVLAQDDEPVVWSPELSMQYKTISQSAMSPDGSRVAYVVREALMEGEKSEYLSHIWMVDTATGESFQFTQGDHSATNPSFSPDGKYLAFTSSRTDKNQIWKMRVMGGEAEQVTDVERGVGQYKWSPDGHHFAFLMGDPDTEEEKKAKKEKRDVILVDQQFKYNHLYTIAAEKNGHEKNEPVRITEGTFHVNSFDWSPDGSNIVFSHQPDPRINTARSGSDISIVNADGGEVAPLVVRPGADGGPRYSPDGQWIAFSTHAGQPENIGLSDIHVIPAGGGDPIPLAYTPDRNASLQSWASDSRSIYVAEAMGTTRELIELPLKGNPRVVHKSDGVKGAMGFSGDGAKVSFSFEKTDKPVDLQVLDLAGNEVKQLTDLHAGVPKPPMGKTEVITWTSPDGMEIEGLLTYPVNYQPGRRYPLVLNIHGGPAGVYTQTFTGRAGIYMIQTFAQKDMAVLRPNPRGSTGYGKDFRYANIMDWGYGDYEDVMSGVDKVIEMGIGHADSLAVMGWSYGGYLTSFTVTRTSRFKAASMGAGLPNLISMVTTTDIQDYLASHMGGEFWNDYETYEKHSAIYRIKNVVTPTQVIHGANDLRVPFTQGQEFYRALDRLGVKTEMIVYPRTPHGPREPKFLKDVTPRIMKWFDKHMRPDHAEGDPSSLE